MIDNLVRRIKYNLIWLKARWACGPKWEEIHKGHYDESIKRIVESKETLCLCGVDRIARQFHDEIESAAQECDAAQEECRQVVPGKSSVDELERLIDGYIRKEIMIGALLSSLNHICENWKIESPASLQSMELYEKYYKMYKSSKKRGSTCHK